MKHIRKFSRSLGAVTLPLFLLSACDSGNEQTSTSSNAEASAPGAPGNAQQQAPEPVGEELRIEIVGDDKMQFDVTEFEVHARQPVTIVFKNEGTMPKESMGHNVVVITEGTDPLEFVTAGARHVRNDYIDPELEGQVIARMPIIGPGEVQEVSFVAPAEPGEFPYVCTFPGHAQVGMRGVMTVTAAP